MDVRVDPGPQDGTVLVTWIPVTLNVTAGGKDKTSPVTGYAVFADGKRVTDVDSPSSKIQTLTAYISSSQKSSFNPDIRSIFLIVESKESPGLRLILINITEYRFAGVGEAKAISNIGILFLLQLKESLGTRRSFRHKSIR